MEPMIYVVDDDEAVRDAVGLLLKSVSLDFQLFDEANAFIDQYETDVTAAPGKPACLLLDIRMPGMSGLELQTLLLDRGYRLPIIFMTGHGDVPMAVQALQNGAADFMLKPFRDQDLLDRINEILQDLAASADKVALREQALVCFQSLTEREKQVMKEVTAGKANKVIAIDLELSQRTVEIHRSRVMDKMKARSLADLVRKAMLLEDE